MSGPAQDAGRPLSREHARHIASAFLPGHLLGNRHHYYYARAKLRSDPLYPGVCHALSGSTAPVLDLGCGLGLLAHALHQAQVGVRYFGVDNDARKVTAARRAARRAVLADAGFECLDLVHAVPPHRGSVAILDLLQYLPPARQPELVAAAMDMLVPGARLVIRTGLEDGSPRGRITRAGDVIARLAGWNNRMPTRYPETGWLRALFQARGLDARFSRLSGDTPFNNWLIVAEGP